MARMVDADAVKIVWIDKALLTTPNAPKVSELTAGTVLDLTCIMLASSKISAAGSDTVSERAVCETANVVTPTVKNYEGSLDLFRDFTAGVASATDPTTKFAGNYETGYIVIREGSSSTVPFAVGNKVDVYLFIADQPQKVSGKGEGFLKMTVPLFPQGVMKIQTTTVA